MNRIARGECDGCHPSGDEYAVMVGRWATGARRVHCLGCVVVTAPPRNGSMREGKLEAAGMLVSCVTLGQSLLVGWVSDSPYHGLWCRVGHDAKMSWEGFT